MENYQQTHTKYRKTHYKQKDKHVGRQLDRTIDGWTGRHMGRDYNSSRQVATLFGGHIRLKYTWSSSLPHDIIPPCPWRRRPSIRSISALTYSPMPYYVSIRLRYRLHSCKVGAWHMVSYLQASDAVHARRAADALGVGRHRALERQPRTHLHQEGVTRPLLLGS